MHHADATTLDVLSLKFRTKESGKLGLFSLMPHVTSPISDRAAGMMPRLSLPCGML